MSRRPISGTERLRIFKRENGVCHLCGGKVNVGEAWDVSHEIPLALGGDDEGNNRRVAHTKCHKAHTAANDIPAIAKAKRRERAHLGIRARKGRPMPGSRDSPFKKKMDGSVVRR